MDDRSELTAFISLLEGWSLSACEIALWHALRDVSIQCGRSAGLSIATGRLTVLTGFSKKSVERARDRLRDLGVIQWSSRTGRKSAVYTMNSLVRHRDAQTTPQGYPQSTPQTTPQGTPINTTTVINRGRNLPRHGDAQTTPQSTPQATPQNGAWLSDDEITAAGDEQRRMDEVFQRAVDIGIPNTTSDLLRCGELISQYTPEWVEEALRRTAGRPASARCWGYVEGVLRNWAARGGIDDAEKPAQSAEAELQAQETRRRFQEQSERILRGEYDA